MFYYYGRKKRIAGLYPEPLHGTIIEPFAGSAAYSLHGTRWKNEVILYDTSSIVVGIWEYLISATKEDILSLPDLQIGTKVRECHTQLSEPELDLIGLHCSIGKPTKKATVGRFNRWAPGKRYIADNLYKIKHWKISQQSFETIDHKEPATWFIDPPYQYAGSVYKHSKGSKGNQIDYDLLSNWSKSRPGLIIACGEFERDTWLPFEYLTKTKSAGTRSSAEGVYLG